jgi:pilus assembly protein CpaB
MKKNLVPLLGIAFVVAIASTGIFYGLFVNKLRNPRGFEKTLVVAAHDLKKGVVLRNKDLKTAPWAGEKLPSGTFGDVRGVLGTTVVESMRQGEPVLQERVISKDGGKDGELGIPAGMRAVSVHVTDSTGVLELIRRGYKVDVQVVRTHDGSREPVEVRTVLEDVPVLSVGAAEASAGGFTAPVVTVLAKPEQADVLAIADTAARIRLALRNPLDDASLRPQTLSLAALFRVRRAAGRRGGAVRAKVSPAPSSPLSAAASHAESKMPVEPDRTISLWVSMAGVYRDGVDEINSQLIAPNRTGLLQVLPFRPNSDAEAAIRNLEDRHLIDIVSRARLTAGLIRVVSVQAGTYPENPKLSTGGATYGVRVRFSPFVTANGSLRLRVSPEVAAPDGNRIVVRRAETEAELADGRSFLVSGLTGAGNQAPLFDRLFAGHAPPRASNMELLVLVTPRVNGSVRTATLR